MMPMAVQRLRDALHIRGDGIDAIAKLLQVHPLLPDDYVRSGVANRRRLLWSVLGHYMRGSRRRRHPEPAQLVEAAGRPTFDSLVWTVNPQAVIEPIDPSEVPESDAAVVWRFRIDPDASPPELPWTANMIGIDGMATFDLTERPAVPVVLRARH